MLLRCWEALRRMRITWRGLLDRFDTLHTEKFLQKSTSSHPHCFPFVQWTGLKRFLRPGLSEYPQASFNLRSVWSQTTSLTLELIRLGWPRRRWGDFDQNDDDHQQSGDGDQHNEDDQDSDFKDKVNSDHHNAVSGWDQGRNLVNDNFHPSIHWSVVSTFYDQLPT